MLVLLPAAGHVPPHHERRDPLEEHHHPFTRIPIHSLTASRYRFPNMVAWQGKFSFQCIFFIALLTQEAHQYAAVMSAGPPHIAVVGSSVGGLSAAVALRSKGFSVEVFEKASALLPVGATIGLATNGLAALNFVSKRAHDKLCSQLDAEAVRVVRDINGDVISQTNRPGTSKTVLWHSLQQSLLGDLPNDQLNLGHEFLRYEQEDDHIRSTFRLGDGTERTYISDALIGADGVSSQVRTAMLGDVPLNFYNKFIFRAILDRPPTVSVPERSFNIWKSSVPGQQLSIISFGATARAFALSGSKSVECCIDSEDKPAQKEWIQSQFANYPATLRDVIASAAAESIHLAKIADIDMLPTWTRGPVALLGDAAHAMTPGTGSMFLHVRVWCASVFCMCACLGICLFFCLSVFCVSIYGAVCAALCVQFCVSLFQCVVKGGSMQ